MKSNKKVFLLKCDTLSSKSYTQYLNFRIDTTTLFTKNNHTNIEFKSFFNRKLGNFKTVFSSYKTTITNYQKIDNVIVNNIKYSTSFTFENSFPLYKTTNDYITISSKSIELTALNLKDDLRKAAPKKNVKIKYVLKHKQLKIKSDTSSVAIKKDVNYFNHIPNIIKKNAPTDEEHSTFLNYKTSHK